MPGIRDEGTREGRRSSGDGRHGRRDHGNGSLTIQTGPDAGRVIPDKDHGRMVRLIRHHDPQRQKQACDVLLGTGQKHPPRPRAEFIGKGLELCRAIAPRINTHRQQCELWPNISAHLMVHRTEQSGRRRTARLAGGVEKIDRDCLALHQVRIKPMRSPLLVKHFNIGDNGNRRLRMTSGHHGHQEPGNCNESY